MALVGDRPTDLRDRWPVVDQPADDQLRAVIEQIASSRHAARRTAAGAVRRPLHRRAAHRRHDLDGGRAAARARPACSTPSATSSTSSRRAARRTSPASRTAPRCPTTALLDGPAGRGVTTGGRRRPRRRRHVDGDADADRRRRRPPGHRRRGAPASSTSARRSTTPGASRSVVPRTSPDGPSFGVTTAYDVAAAGPAELGYAQPSSRTLALVAAGAAVARRARRGQPASPCRTPAAAAPHPRRDADRPRRRAGGGLPGTAPGSAAGSTSSSPTRRTPS